MWRHANTDQGLLLWLRAFLLGRTAAISSSRPRDYQLRLILSRVCCIAWFDAARLSDTQILSLNLRVRILRQNPLIFSTASSPYSPDSVAGIASHHVPHVTAPAATKLPLLLNDPDLSHEPHLSAAHGTADTVEPTGSSDHGRCDRGDGDEHRNRTIALSGPPGYQAENTAPHAPQKEHAQLEVPNRGWRVLR